MTANIPLLDLREQYDTIRDEVDAAIRRVVDSQRFILGEEVEAFEQALAAYLDDGREVVGCASGTDALLLSLKALDLQPGDEVIVPAFTFFATAGAVWNAGLKPVFCDVEPAHFNVTAEVGAGGGGGVDTGGGLVYQLSAGYRVALTERISFMFDIGKTETDGSFEAETYTLGFGLHLPRAYFH